ncbi:MAG: hypothetical protein H7Z41_04015 [Cytophagales bacterium]|nr:hypothetical protein [Armatimonadota bacterium]
MTFTNREMAAVLFNIATVLRQSGNTNPFRTAAYERGARALMGLRHEVCDVLGSQEKVSFRRRQHIGKKLHAKIQEMARSGALGQYEAMLQDLPRHQRQLMLVPGIGPKTADLLYAATGIEQTADLVRAAREGRLRRVRGFGPKRTAQIAALPLPEDAAASRQLSLF